MSVDVGVLPRIILMISESMPFPLFPTITAPKRCCSFSRRVAVYLFENDSPFQVHLLHDIIRPWTNLGRFRVYGSSWYGWSIDPWSWYFNCSVDMIHQGKQIPHIGNHVMVMLKFCQAPCSMDLNGVVRPQMSSTAVFWIRKLGNLASTRAVFKSVVGGWLDGWKVGWMQGWLDGWKIGWM